MQLVFTPFFGILEVLGVMHGAFIYNPKQGFHVVQKEKGKANLSNTEKLAITEQDVDNNKGITIGGEDNVNKN